MYKIIITEIDEQGVEKPFMDEAGNGELYKGFLFFGEEADGVRSFGGGISSDAVISGLAGTNSIREDVVIAAGLIMAGGGSANAPS